MEIRVDQRRLVIGSAPEAEAIALREIDVIRRSEVVLGQALERIERERSFVRAGCSSAEDWAVRQGVDRRRATELLRFGRLMAATPRAAEKVLGGDLTSQAAAAIGRLVPRTPTVPPKSPVDPAAEQAQQQRVTARAEDWLEHAATVAPTTLRNEVAAAVEEIAQEDRVVPLRFLVRQSVRVTWRRARKLASRKAGRMLTGGQAFDAVTSDYLARHDDLQKEPRKRRVGPTSERPNDRYVPTEVRRRVTRRAKDHCEFPGCGNGVFTEFTHRERHADGGDREEGNLGKHCGIHHRLEEAGKIRMIERTPEGSTYVIVATGEIVAPDPKISAVEPLPGPVRGASPSRWAARGRSKRASSGRRKTDPDPADAHDPLEPREPPSEPTSEADSLNLSEPSDPPDGVRETPPSYARPFPVVLQPG